MNKVIKYWGTAGTGKTTRLLKDLGELRSTYDLERDICFCTYAQPMANDFLKNFYHKLLEEDYPGYQKCIKRFQFYATIHGVCKRLLPDTYNVINTKDDDEDDEHRKGKENHQRTFSEKQKLDYDTGRNSESTGDLFFMTKSWLTNTLKNNRECNEFPGENKLDYDMYQRLLTEYIKFKKDLGNYIDFDDMLMKVYKEGISPPTKVLIVDEFQDLSPLQYAIYSNWRDTSELTIIAGDPNQSIYDFQGASPQYFIKEQATMEVLPKTFRLGNRSWMFAKKLLSDYGLPIPEVSAEERDDKIVFVDRENMTQFVRPKTKTFFLAHTNKMAREIIGKELIDAGIPFMGSQSGGWGNKMLSVFNCVCLLTRGEENSFVSDYDYRRFLDSLKKEYLIPGLSKNSKKEGALNISTLQLPNSINLITLRKYINPLFVDSMIKIPFDFSCLNGKWDIGRKRLNGSIDIEHTKANKLNKVLSNPRFSHIGQPGLVYVGTIHSSKGREKDDVFLFDQISSPAFEDTQVTGHDKIARLFFVGVTRHKKNLYIVHENMFNSHDFEFPSLISR
jgi:superfamily I DNA/RNA helicase